MKKTHPFDLSSATLHLLAMFFMLLDHSWARLLPSQEWMTCVGRLAFPIFAFMIVEGVHHTHDLTRYMKRMLLFALLSEIPFDLMYASTPFYPYHQNVLWTFLIALCGIRGIETVKKKQKKGLTVAASVGIVLGTSILSLICMTDYNMVGVFTVYVFYFFRGKRWWCYLGQFVTLWYLNVEILGGLCYVVEIMGVQLEIVQQGLALLALPIIWLYQGRKGYSSKWFQYFCYGFYPVHCLLISLLAKL
ncbi:MAG: conjugal transfer protein TraX [Oscillospiraceae bacterium]|nr:conjugal transfer protein TraX [Oscillospiraceae bacterium]